MIVDGGKDTQLFSYKQRNEKKYLVVSEIMCTFANVNYSKTIVSHNYETISTDSCNDGNSALRHG